jgi:4-aminobutyrate aminotransferase-like enzyme
VAHVGHGNARVAQAVSEQIQRVNSNSRYLHPLRAQLAAKLLSLFPPPLSQGCVFFVNSGSEANDLAARLATAYTGGQELVVQDGAYHGHTAATIQLSPYKFRHKKYLKAGWPVPQHTHIVPCPNTFRGWYRVEDNLFDDGDIATRYANHVKEACAALAADPQRRLAGMIVETGMSVGGVVLPPSGYLPQCFAHIRAAGGVCIADEVQTGLGRLGNFWWAFESQHVVPDIVTIGKPFGNGLPLAAVVAVPAVVRAFEAGPEYFNTFGGNPVCCAAGLAVLAEIERLNLRQHAADIGALLKQRLLHLQQHTLQGKYIGDIRGQGLFLGVEFVKDRQAEVLQPATALASSVCTQLRARHNILTSLDGPDDNVMVIKPPLVFGEHEVDVFITALSEELLRADQSLVAERSEVDVEHTPT